MTIYDKIIQMDEETMAEFLCSFASDVIDSFSNFVLPSKEAIQKLLKSEVPE